LGRNSTNVRLSFFFDERANEQQREALNMIFSGKTGGFMAEFAKLTEIRVLEYGPIEFQAYWQYCVYHWRRNRHRSRVILKQL
jgi:hypothetical protein